MLHLLAVDEMHDVHHIFMFSEISYACFSSANVKTFLQTCKKMLLFSQYLTFGFIPKLLSWEFPEF